MIPGDKKANVLIYADPLLPPSETFIMAQGEALENFTPYYIGPKSLGHLGLKMPTDRTVAINGIRGQVGRIREAPFRYFGYAPLYFRRLRRLSPVLLHAHFGPGGLRALGLAEWLGIPLITTFHGFDATIGDSFALRGKFGHRDYVRRRYVLRQKGQLFIAVSNFIRAELLLEGFSDEKTVVHYIGIDTELFRPDPRVEREPIVLFVGRLAEKKGCEYVIRAMAKVEAAFPRAELVVVGDGPLRVELESLAGQTLARCRFLGFQPPEVVRQWMNRARVFAAPSLRARSGDADGYPIAFAEAQAMGLPVVSFAYGGILEAVSDKETGFLVPERDIEGLARHLQGLLQDEALCTRMGEAARRRVCAHFNLRIQTQKLEELYTEVLGR